MADLADLTLDYRAAFLRYLPQRSEAALTLGYQLGRRAVDDGVSLLDLVGVHHVVLAELIEDMTGADAVTATHAASDFLLEVLSTFDMAHRSLRRSSDLEQDA
ncbi:MULTISPECIES: phosphatase RsbU N-terminal domain-containing protein [unclassified Knoellia]|uniref:phosphatase RsbU N-terminal domain-containing protein n=1 Tax=Knoellia altitudinis TaxID=3404795 RepID=UPI0036215691